MSITCHVWLDHVKTMFVKTMHVIPKWKLLIPFVPNDPVWSSLIRFDQVWSSLFRFDQVWSSLIRFDQVWSSLIRFHQVWSILYRSDPIWSKLNDHIYYQGEIDWLKISRIRKMWKSGKFGWGAKNWSRFWKIGKLGRLWIKN